MPSITFHPRPGWESSSGISRLSHGFRRPSMNPAYAPSLIETFRSSSVRGPCQSFDSDSPYGRSPSPAGLMYSEIGSLEQSEVFNRGFHAARPEGPTDSGASFASRVHGFSDNLSTDRHDARLSSPVGTWGLRHGEDGLWASMTDETGTA